MGRYHRPLAGWPGDVELMPHLLDVLRMGALDAEVSFGEPVDYRADSKRKDVSATIAQRIRAMLNSSLRGRDIA